MSDSLGDGLTPKDFWSQTPISDLSSVSLTVRHQTGHPTVWTLAMGMEQEHGQVFTAYGTIKFWSGKLNISKFYENFKKTDFSGFILRRADSALTNGPPKPK